MSDYFLYAGDLDPPLDYQIMSGGVPVPIPGTSTVTFSMRLAGSVIRTLDDVPVTIIDGPTGKVRHSWAAGETDVYGTWIGWFTVTDNLGDSQTTPEFSFPIYSHTIAWCAACDVARCAGVSDDALGLQDAAVMASELLYELSGRLFDIQRDTVRPCRTGCGCWAGGSFADGIPPALLQWGAWGIGQGYGWGWDGCTNLVGCNPLSEIELPGFPVDAVNQVKVDGSVLSPTLYRLDEYDRLVRTDGIWWPTCQNMNLADTQPGTWSVDYTWGSSPPRIGSRAAAQLGAELYKACGSSGCSLPLAATMIVRQGVRIERGLAASFAKIAKEGGGFGLTLVDAFLAAYNPNGLTEQPTVWSPDVQQDPRRVGT